MNRGITTRARIAALAAAVGLAALVMAPTAAFAATKAATRLVVVTQTIVDNSAPGVTPAAPNVTVKLQKKVSGKWVALKGAIKLALYDSLDSSWTTLSTKTGSSASFPLYVRGRYRVTYAGSSTAKPATSYTKRIDMVGGAITPVSVTRSDLDETWTQITASYNCTWNVDAFPLFDSDTQLEFQFYGTYDNGNNLDPYYSGDVEFYQQLWESGTVRVSYWMRIADIPGGPTTKFYSDARLVSQDPYVMIDPTSEQEEYTTPQVR